MPLPFPVDYNAYRAFAAKEGLPTSKYMEKYLSMYKNLLGGGGLDDDPAYLYFLKEDKKAADQKAAAEKARQEAAKKAQLLAAQQAQQAAAEQARKIAQAQREAQERARIAAAEKARHVAAEQARIAAEKQAKQAALEQAKRIAQQQAAAEKARLAESQVKWAAPAKPPTSAVPVPAKIPPAVVPAPIKTAPAAVAVAPAEEVKNRQEHVAQQALKSQEPSKSQTLEQILAEERAMEQLQKQAEQKAAQEEMLREANAIRESQLKEFQSPQQAQSAAQSAAINEAQKRIQAFQQIPMEPPAAPAVHNPNSSTMASIDPERARINKIITKRAEAGLNQPPLPVPSLEDRFAIPTAEELQPLVMARKHGIQNPHYEAAKETIQGAHKHFPTAVHDYMNPYTQHVINRIADEGNRNLLEHIIPALESRFIRTGSSRGKIHNDLKAKAIADTQREISSLQGQALASGYETAAKHFDADIARQMEIARMHQGLGQQSQASRLADMSALQEAEKESRAFRQNLKDFRQQELERLHYHPSESLNRFIQNTHGMPYATSTHHYRPPPPPQHRPPQGFSTSGLISAAIPFLSRMF